MSQLLQEHVIVITGASSGIGAALARLVASQGACVVLAARGLDALEDVAAACGGKGRAIAVRCDVTIKKDVEHLLAAALAEFGKVRI